MNEIMTMIAALPPETAVALMAVALVLILAVGVVGAERGR
jgi:hypothetical protein